ncbi:MAG: phenylalanine--tRNA ligase subunit beta [Clostridia bacterium]|nr:phenylalanine--tRNA ligase subunit beta [Clostridia bacterium]
MRVSWKWLNELVEVKVSPKELARLMTMSGIEVGGIECFSKGLKDVRVGLIEKITKHPQADKLVICDVNIGGDKRVTIVTGASNVREGQKVPVAIAGAILADGKQIKSADFRGIMSKGMLCSAEELGMDVDKIPAEQKDGIYILPNDVSVGDDIVETLDLEDIVMELELTPNRADCLGMINVAREVAALTGEKLNLPVIEESNDKGECASLTRIDIEDKELCGRYVARIIKNVKIEPSPLWLQHRLMATGMRPINNIVDVTNYVMMEMGQPLHAFDFDKLNENRIVVRKAKKEEEITTLDGQVRKLEPDMLVIADAQKPVAIAGVMGGLDSEVTNSTKTIFLESAYFNGSSIRRTSHTLGLRSEASWRFEKTVDVEQVKMVADRAVQLLAQIGGGTPAEGYVDCYPNKVKRKPIKLRINKVNKVLGTEIQPETMEEILKVLQIAILERDEEGWLLMPPSYRQDLEIEVDMIEEITRMNGYDKIPTTLPEGAMTQGMRTAKQKFRYKMRKLMVAQGLMEVFSYSFINPMQLDYWRVPTDHFLRDVVTIKNPLSEEQGVMRTTILPGLLETVKRNINKRNKDVKLFEIGKVFFSNGFPENSEIPEEKLMLAAICSGKKEKSWLYGEEEYDFYYLKGVVENLLDGLGFNREQVSYEAVADVPGLHPGRTAIIRMKGKEIGMIGEIHPLTLDKYGIEQKVAVFNIEAEVLANEVVDKKEFVVPITKYPAVARDLAITIPEEIKTAAVAELINEQGGMLLKGVRLFDLYRGKQITEGYKSLAFSLTWQAPDKTLTDGEINILHQKIEESLKKEFGAGLRC